MRGPLICLDCGERRFFDVEVDVTERRRYGDDGGWHESEALERTTSSPPTCGSCSSSNVARIAEVLG